MDKNRKEEINRFFRKEYHRRLGNNRRKKYSKEQPQPGVGFRYLFQAEFYIVLTGLKSKEYLCNDIPK